MLKCLMTTIATIALVTTSAHARCAQFPETASTAFSVAAGKITLPWREDLPITLVQPPHAWDAIDFKTDWQGYASAVLGEVKASGVSISNNGINMNPSAEWWIAPWMDYGNNGRESALGLTKERGPSPGDLGPGSPGGRQVWAIGWYNAEGAFALGKVFADYCNPQIPGPVNGVPWTFPNGTASFKLLFTTATETDVPYLTGAPTVLANIGSGNTPVTLRLLQVDIGVRDARATDTEWVMGTYVWKGPKTGDGFFDNLVPVGLMWGNNPGVHNSVFANFAAVSETKLNPALEGIVWQGQGGGWPERPFPGFQGRLNGPADNLRSSCLSCHGLAQWRRHPQLSIVPSYSISPPPDENKIKELITNYFKNVKGGTLNDPSIDAISLDYSLQLEAAFTRMCQACNKEDMTGNTPMLCKMPGNGQITRDTCEKSLTQRVTSWVGGLFSEADPETPPRQ